MLPEEAGRLRDSVSGRNIPGRRHRAESVAARIFCALAILLFATLVYYSLGVTGENPNMNEWIVLNTEIIWQQAALCAAAVALLLPLGRFFAERGRCGRLALAMVCMAAVGAGVFWVATIASIPDGDQAVLISIAGRCNRGDYSDFDRLGYMTQCPHQLGMLTALRIFQAIFGEGNYQAFRYFNVCCIPLIICSGYYITGYLTERTEAQWWYLCLAVCCFPMYGYLPFVYGEISSTALTLFSAWMLLSCLDRFRWKKALLSGLGMGLAIVLRRNSLIALIAFAIVILIKLTAGAAREKIYLLVCLLAGCLLLQDCVKLSWRDVLDREYPAQPNILYVVMGLNDDYGRPGWSNRYNFTVFADCDGDEEAMAARAREDLDMYRQLYRSDRAYRNDFFTRKMNAQWQAPLYQCLAMNNKILPDVREPGRIAKWIYYGSGGLLLSKFMKLYQMLLYICVLFLLVRKGKKDISIEQYALLVGVFGNFLFSLMWEAKTRYIFPSLLMLLPYYAAGMQALLERVRAVFANAFLNSGGVNRRDMV